MNKLLGTLVVIGLGVLIWKEYQKTKKSIKKVKISE